MGGVLVYDQCMSKPVPASTVRDAATGRLVTVRGVGALKGKLTLKAGIDLTKPIFQQVSAATPSRSQKR